MSVRWTPALCAVASGLCLLPASGALQISEFMAFPGEEALVLDGDGEAADWIEIFNPGPEPVNLESYALTDRPQDLDRWVFPAVLLEASSRLVVFASGKDRSDPDEELHTSFQLGREEEGYLALVYLPSQTVESGYASYPRQREGVSFGLYGNAGEPVVGYFEDPTPGSPNGEGVLGFVGDTRFSVDRGYFDAPFLVEISCDTPGAEIWYSVNGRDPSTSSVFSPAAVRYTGPIEITTTTTLRAYALKAGYRSSNVDTQSYLFLRDVLRQTGAGLPQTWNGAAADYEMDPEVVGHADYRDTILADFQTIPALSVAMHPDDFFSTDDGIYPGKIGADGIEKPCSTELLLPDGTEGFQADCSIQIVGGSSVDRWKTHKLSMRLRFSSEYGESKLRYPVFPGDAGAADVFDTLVVDAGLNNNWAYQGGSEPVEQRRRADSLRDQFTADLQRELGGAAPRGRYVHLFINGVYWGMYNLHERPDDNFAATYLGGRSEEYDVLKHNTNTVVVGSAQPYRDLMTAAGGAEAPEGYVSVEQRLAVDEFIDYMLVNFVTGNTDWAHQNWYASSRRDSPTGRWRYHSWDAEKGLQGLNDNVVTKNDAGGPTGLHRLLMESPEYRMRFADRVQKHLGPGGALTTEGLQRVYQRRTAEIDRAVILESARWGDTATGVTRPYTRNEHWVAQRDYLMNTYFVQRPAIVWEQLEADGLTAPLLAPAFSQNGGFVEEGFELAILKGVFAAGDIYYTLDGSDPRMIGGALSESAVRYTGPFALDDSGTVRTRLFRSTIFGGKDWSALVEAQFSVGAEPASPQNVVVSQLHYHPHDPSAEETAAGFNSAEEFEFLELMNVGTRKVSLSGCVFTDGIAFAFAGGEDAELDPGERVVLAGNAAAFVFRYGSGVPLAGAFEGRLNNSGETIRLENAEGEVVLEFAYSDSVPWHEDADGSGPALVLRSPGLGLDPSAGESWRRSRGDAVPGQDDRLDYGVWITEALGSLGGGPEGMDPQADPDGDDLVNGVEYVLGSDPGRPDSLSVMGLGVSRGLQDEREIRIRHGVRIGVDARPRLWVSEDLRDWRLAMGAEIELIERRESGTPGVEVEIWRWLGNAGEAAYFRLGYR